MSTPTEEQQSRPASSLTFLTNLFDQAEAALRQDRLQVATDHTAATAGRVAPSRAAALQREIDAASQRVQQQQQQRQAIVLSTPQYDPYMGGGGADSAAATAAVRLENGDDEGDGNEEFADTLGGADVAEQQQQQQMQINIPARLPLPTLKLMLDEAQRYHKVMSKILEQLRQHTAERGVHLHPPPAAAAASDATEASAESNTTATSNAYLPTPPEHKYLRAFSKIALKIPTDFPALNEHLLGMVVRSMQGLCALAVFADCAGTAVLVDSRGAAAASGGGLLPTPNADGSASSSSGSGGNVSPFVNGDVNALAVLALPEPIRRQAELALFQAAIDSGRPSHTCPLTLVEMLRSRGEWPARLGECVCREAERLYRVATQWERNRRMQKQQQQQQPEQKPSSEAVAVAVDDEATAAEAERDAWYAATITKRADALRAIYSAQRGVQSVLQERGRGDEAAALAGSWLLFVRHQIAPRLLRWVSQIVDPVADTLSYVGANNDLQQSAMQSTSTSSADEEVWSVFQRCYERVLVPFVEGCDCDSVRTVLYRCLLVFEGRMRRQHHVVAGGGMPGGPAVSAVEHHQQQHQPPPQHSGVATAAGNRSMLDLASDALLRRCGAAVYAASFTAPGGGGYPVYIAEGGPGMRSGPIHFYVTNTLALFAQRGLLRGPAAAYRPLASIDDLVNFALS